MLQLRLVTLSLGFLAGIAAAMLLPAPADWRLYLPGIIAGLAWSLVLIRRERRWETPRKFQALAACLLLAIPLGAWRTATVYRDIERDPLRQIVANLGPNSKVRLQGRISAEPSQLSPTRGTLEIMATNISLADGAGETALPGSPVQLSLFLPAEAAPEETAAFLELLSPEAYGWKIAAEFRHRPRGEPLNPGEFNMDAHLRIQGLAARFRVGAPECRILSRDAGNPAMALALNLKARFLKAFKDTIPHPVSRLVAGTTLGSRDALRGIEFNGREIPETFRRAGVGHVLAVSGLHVSIIALLLYSFFHLCGMRPGRFAPLVILMLVIFMLMTGARPATVRAVLMNAIVVLSVAYFRSGLKGATVNGLAAASLLILAHNPLALLNAGFLLSFCAVVALVAITPPLDRLIRRQRGFALGFLLCWLGLILALAVADISLLLRAGVWAALLTLLPLLIQAGQWLNARLPRAWLWGFSTRRWRTVRLFVMAQLAIQIGMMVPLSAYFFGQFPIAGIFVNLLAIPLLGLLVQISMLAALLGAIPLAGPWLALPFGATTGLLGKIFLWSSDIGAYLFPFPAVPKPTPFWMCAYYGGLVLVLLLYAGRRHLASALRKFRGTLPERLDDSLGRAAGWLPLGLFLISLAALWLRQPEAKSAIVLHGSGVPNLGFVDNRARAWLLNPGSGYFADSAVFAGLRHLGAVHLELAAVGTPWPRHGSAGLARLGQRLDLRHTAMPVRKGSPAAVLDEIDNRYLRRNYESGKDWAVEMVEGAAEFNRRFAAKLWPPVLDDPAALDLLAPPDLPENLRLRLIPALTAPPSRTRMSLPATVLAAEFHGTRWLAISEAEAAALELLAPRVGWENCDLLLLPDARPGRENDHNRMTDTAVSLFNPEIVIVCGYGSGWQDAAADDELADSAKPAPGAPLRLHTRQTGAIIARPAPGGIILRPTRGDREIFVPARRPAAD